MAEHGAHGDLRRPHTSPASPARRRFLATGLAAGAAGAAALAGCTTGDDAGGPADSATPGTATGAAPPGALADLQARLRGRLLLPADGDFTEASQPKNARFGATRPLAVAEVADADDVVSCVRWCTEHGVAPVARGGGHSYAGLSTTNGLLISLARLNTVDLDRSTGVGRVGGAAHNADVFAAEVDGPFILPGGTCLPVGVGGLTLGGGIGYNARWAGLTCDRLISSQIVTADGELRTISTSEEPDLFWACRGGAGGSFGINTEFTFEFAEVPRDTVGFYDLTWQGAEAAGAVLTAFDELMQTAPDAFNAVAYAQATPVGAGGPRAAIKVESRGIFLGTADELRDLVAPLLAAGGDPATSTLQDQPFWQTQKDRTAPESPLHSWGDISRYARGAVPADAYAQVAELVAACPQRSDEANGAFWAMGWVGGSVIGRYGRTDTAYVHRDATNLLRPTVEWPTDADPGVARELEAWVGDVIAVLDPHTPDESYQNFPNRLIAEWPRAYYGENWERLVAVKSAVDPADVFSNPQSIPPNPS